MPPVITSGTGTVADGAAVVLVGTAFGTKPSGPPLKFETFEGTTNGAVLDGVNGWTAEDDSLAVDTNITTSNTAVRTNSTRSARVRFDPSSSSHNFWFSDSMNTSTVYIDFWARFILSPGSGEPANYKMFRMYNNTAGAPNHYWGYAGGGIMQSDQAGEPLPEPPYYSWWTGPNIPDFDDSFGHFQWEYVMGADPFVGGTMSMYFNGEQRSPSHVINSWQTRRPGDTTVFNKLLFGNYAYPTANGFDVYFDDIYVDNSRCRVELGNNATYANCTQREIVPLTAHSNTSITATLRKGAFSSYTGLYLFVVDHLGVPSAGFATSSITGGGPPPDPPITRGRPGSLGWI